MATVDGKFSWVKITNPDVDDYDNETFQVTLEPDDASKAKLVAEGMKPHNNNDEIFTFKRPTTWPSGDARDTPKCIDSDGMPIDPATVGNGSSGTLQYKIIEGVWKKKAYKKFDFCAMRIDDLIVYGGVDGDELVAKTEEGASPDVDTDDNPFG